MCCRRGFLSTVFCIVILKPALQYPVHYSVSLLLWRNGLGLGTLSFSVSISGPTSCLLPLCRQRGIRMALFSGSVFAGTGAVMFPGVLTAFIHAVTELLTPGALCVLGIVLCLTGGICPPVLLQRLLVCPPQHLSFSL